MKNYFTALLLITLWMIHFNSIAQLTYPHQNQAPPVNPGYPFVRGMFVDCADKIILDVANGNSLGLKQELINYISGNFISYIILCDLENAGIFGDPIAENALRQLMVELRHSIPGLKIGIQGSNENFFQSTGYLNVWERFGKECYSYGVMRSTEKSYGLLNGPSSAPDMKKSEMCKFFFRAATFNSSNERQTVTDDCETAFDVLYVKYRYWQQTSSLADMQNEFNQFKEVLNLLRVLKCQYNCTGAIDAEFLPTEIFNLQGWTAIDQITDIDPLVDRLVIPAYTNLPGRIFSMSCKTMHFLTDPFSKPGTQFFISLSAESSLFSYCNSSQTPENYLGNYLNGMSHPAGNMYWVEQTFLNTFNSQQTICQACQCPVYTNNHFTSSNMQGNILTGVMWGPYTQMKDHHLFRKKNNAESDETGNAIKSIQIFDLLGRLVLQSKNQLLEKDLQPGLYVEIKTRINGTIVKSKIWIDNNGIKNTVPAGPPHE